MKRRTRSFKLALVGLGVLDLTIGSGALLAANHVTKDHPSKLNATQVAQLLDRQTQPSPAALPGIKPLHTCSADPTGGWDYLCRWRDQRGLYDVNTTG